MILTKSQKKLRKKEESVKHIEEFHIEENDFKLKRDIKIGISFLIIIIIYKSYVNT